MVRKSLSPCLSINVTSLRSTTHFRFPSVRRVSFQHFLSSLTHNPTKRPCKVHFSSIGVSVLVIFNTSISLIWESVRLAAAVVNSGGYRVEQRGFVDQNFHQLDGKCLPAGSDVLLLPVVFPNSNAFS